MKLRIRGDTLRLRLTRGEVADIGAGRAVEEATRFPDGSVLRYVLSTGDEYTAAQHNAGAEHLLRVTIPAARAAAWAESEEVGLSGDGPVQLDALAVLIEKDFSCVTPRAGEEELDTYPNPDAA